MMTSFLAPESGCSAGVRIRLTRSGSLPCILALMMPLPVCCCCFEVASLVRKRLGSGADEFESTRARRLGPDADADGYGGGDDGPSATGWTVNCSTMGLSGWEGLATTQAVTQNLGRKRLAVVVCRVFSSNWLESFISFSVNVRAGGKRREKVLLRRRYNV